MKTKLNNFLEELSKKEDQLIDESVFSKVEINKDFKESLFSEIHTQSSLDSFISEEADYFACKHITNDMVFENRHSLFYDYINEILAEQDGASIKNVSDIDKVYKDAGYRYLLNIGHDIGSQLLAVYCLRDVYQLLSELDKNTLLDSSDYSDFDDIEELTDSFVEEVLNEAESSNDIINIEDLSKKLCEDYFGISL